MLSRSCLGRWKRASRWRVIRLLPRAHILAGKLAGGLVVQRLGKGAAQRGVVCQARHVSGKLAVVPNWENIAVFARVDQFGHAAHIRADGRAARADAFEDGVRESFGHRGQKVDVHCAEKRPDWGNPAAERHALRHAELGAQPAEHLLILAVARDEQAQLRRLLKRRGKAAHGRRNILDRGQTRGDPAQHVARLHLHAVGIPQIGQRGQIRPPAV